MAMASPLALPPRYVYPEEERPRLDEVVHDAPIPVIDIGDPDRSHVAKQIGCASAKYSAFQIRNHGMEERWVEAMVDVAHELFEQPLEVKARLYPDKWFQTIRLSASSDATGEELRQWGDNRKRQWKDCVRFQCSPPDDFVPECFSHPPAFREVVNRYCKETRNLGFKLFELLSESLGLDKDYIAKVVGGSGLDQQLAMFYYHPCPQPELTYGHQPHRDHSICTLILQDQVGGLQIFHEGKWLQVQPHPGAFVVVIGDMLQALSNAKYKSVLHRVVTNSHKERLSVASFLSPFNESVIAAPRELVAEGMPVYRAFSHGEYMKKFWRRSVNQTCCLDCFELGANHESEDPAAPA